MSSARRRPVRLAVIAVSAAVVGLALLGRAGPLQAAAPGGAPAERDLPFADRSFEVLRLDCANQLSRREVTLFGNGTVRLRDGPLGKEWMGLAEIGPDEMQGALRRLAAPDLSDAAHLPLGVLGDWIERCDLYLHLPAARPQKFHFGRYDTLPLSLSEVLRVTADLAAKVESMKGKEQLPEHYEPRLGDLVKRIDGQLYRVVNFTSDKKGVELDGIDQPLHLVVLRDHLRREFVALISRAR
ncbi:MAG TPA: hypothetical protein VHR45_05660 [Thermoanaerobaculia bacterium]|nr:hypothetical protein [Thermoanaerobaculia bacterium]